MSKIFEASYKGNVGMVEMMQLYQIMSDKEIKNLERVIADEDWDTYKKIVKWYLDIDLQ